MDTPKTIQETGLNEQQILFRLNQYNLSLATMEAQKESQLQAFKQDCRRTALQLSERISGKGENDPMKVTANAEILYRWLIADDEVQKDFLDIFMKTGLITNKEV